MANTTARWTISIDIECQSCDRQFDLLDTEPDFWDGYSISPLEHRTSQTRDYQVTCPACKTEFLVDFEY